VILICCAVGAELAFLESIPHVEMLVTGVGPIEAAASLSRALAQSAYALVINAGVAGAFGEATIGEGVVVAEEFMEIGLETGAPLALPDGARVVDRAASELTLVDRLVERGFRSVRGMTVSRVTATDESAQRLAAYGAEIETMEGFAALRAAEIAGVPAIEVRGISNFARDRSQSRWDLAAGIKGLENVLGVLLSMVSGTE